MAAVAGGVHAAREPLLLLVALIVRVVLHGLLLVHLVVVSLLHNLTAFLVSCRKKVLNRDIIFWLDLYLLFVVEDGNLVAPSHLARRPELQRVI